ncbi:MAG: hypothetical protein JO034_14680 [Singulisphaera sp.]|nr:hypothetical protein [Singulisphaera sp.]
MRDSFRTAWALALLTSPLATATVAAQAPSTTPPAGTSDRPTVTTPPAAETAAPPPPRTAPATDTLAPPPTRTNPAPARRPAVARRTVPPVIGAHQINRYNAINQLEAAVKANPNSLADWVILGELAHEVALDAPPDLAAKYYQMSRDAYERALALDPNNAGLQAAVQFARDREAGADRFEQIRDRATRIYLDARRRDLAATGYVPTVRAFGPPLPSRVMPVPANEVLSIETPPVEPTTNPPAPTPVTAAGSTLIPAPGTAPAAVPAAVVAPATPTEPAAAPRPGDADALGTPAGPAATNVPGVGPSADAPSQGAGIAYDNPADPANSVIESHFGVRQIYTIDPSYQPYTAAAGAPFTFQQFSNGYDPANVYGTPGVAPVTVQRYLQQFPQGLGGGRLPAPPTTHTSSPTGTTR